MRTENRRRTGRFAVRQGRIGLGGSARPEHRCCAAPCRHRLAISTTIVTGDPDAQLIRRSKTAAVLVVGRPHEHRWGSWTRSVARTVMRQTHCPLIVAPWAPAEPGPHRALADQALT